MPRRNRRAGAPFSLFAFQDIICSVIGVMILVVILLTLDLLNRAEAQSRPASAASPADGDALRRLRTEAEQAKNALDHARTHLRALREKLAASADDGEDGEIRSLRQQLRRLLEQVAHARKLRNEEESDRQRRAGEMRTLKRELAAMREEIERRTKASRRLSARTRRLVFLPGEDEPRTPIVVEIADDGLGARPLEEGASVTIWREGDFASNARAFLAWADKRKNAFFVVLVRPETIRESMGLVGALRKAGGNVGHEALPPEWSCLF